MSLISRSIHKHIWPGSLHFRLMLIIILAILPLAAGRLWMSSAEHERTITRANEQAVRIANNGVLAALDAVREARNSLDILANIPLLREGSDAACSNQLVGIVNSRPWATGLFALDPTGKVMCGSDPQTLGINISDRAYIKTALETRSFFAGDFIIGRKSLVPMIGSAMPVYDSKGNLIRIFVATIATKWFDRIAADVVAANPGSTATLIDGNNVVLADAPIGGNEIGKVLLSQSMIAAFTHPDMVHSKAMNFSAIGDDGINRLFGVAHLPHSNARLLIGFSHQTVLAELQRQQHQAILELVVLSVLLGTVVWFLGLRAIVNPTATLLAHARRVADGKLDSRIKDKNWLREFSVLARSFNIMTARLERRNKQLQAAQRLLKEQSQTDFLTGISNRRGFDTQLASTWARAVAQESDIAVCMIDADQFKLFNDTYGHGAGDDALCTISSNLKQIADVKGGFAARLGGEEFALLVPNCNETEALSIADLLCGAIRRSDIVHAESAHGVVTVSIGVAHIRPSSGNAISMMLAAADAALYAAKASGRNCAIGATRLGMLLTMQNKMHSSQAKIIEMPLSRGVKHRI